MELHKDHTNQDQYTATMIVVTTIVKTTNITISMTNTIDTMTITGMMIMEEATEEDNAKLLAINIREYQFFDTLFFYELFNCIFC